LKDFGVGWDVGSVLLGISWRICEFLQDPGDPAIFDFLLPRQFQTMMKSFEILKIPIRKQPDQLLLPFPTFTCILEISILRFRDLLLHSVGPFEDIENVQSELCS
jgi:hypothetical protein